MARRKTLRRRGQSLVELALMIPVLAVLSLGVADFGRAMYIYQLLQQAARECAYYGSQYPTDLAGAAAPARTSAGQVGSQITVTAVRDANPADRNQGRITCTVTYGMPLISGVQGLPSTIAMSAVAQVPVAGGAPGDD